MSFKRMSSNNDDTSLRRMLEDAMAAFLSNNLPAVVLQPLQHIANLHREDRERLMRLLYGLRDGPASGQLV